MLRYLSLTYWRVANSFMSLVNLIYLGTLTGRAVLLPPFVPLHIGHTAFSLPFGDVFDLSALSASIHTPVLDWHHVKRTHPDPMQQDAIGCWGTALTQYGSPQHPWQSDTRLGVGACCRAELSRFGLRCVTDLAFTPIPELAMMKFNYDHAISAHVLAALDYPTTRAQALARPPVPPVAAPFSGQMLEPNEHLLCFDHLYWSMFFVSAGIVAR
jgi:hypothetical protein